MPAMTWRALLALCAIAPALPSLARADGAFPDSFQLILPADRAHQLVLGTNFGLVISEDDGVTWRWVCEEAIANYAGLFEIGAPPSDTLFAVSPAGLFLSSDGACTWQAATGGDGITDSFPDPSNPARVVALAAVTTDGGAAVDAVIESTDGGKSFGHALWTAPAGAKLTGIEVGRAAPHPIYVTLYGHDAEQRPQPRIARSTDGGASFQLTAPSPALGMATPRLAAIDPDDPTILYLRVSDAGGERLAISTDGGASFRVAFTTPSRLTAFLRRADKSLLVATQDGELRRSTDGGKSFELRSSKVHVRALAERAGRLFAAADNANDGFAVGVSDDAGMTWQPLLRFDQLCGPVDCPNLHKTCAEPWHVLIATLSISGCGAAADVDAGDERSIDLGRAAPPPRGCGCALGHRAPPASCALLLLATMFALSRRRSGMRRRARRRRGR